LKGAVRTSFNAGPEAVNGIGDFRGCAGLAADRRILGSLSRAKRTGLAELFWSFPVVPSRNLKLLEK
jgi:hypothetical protein